MTVTLKDRPFVFPVVLGIRSEICVSDLPTQQATIPGLKVAWPSSWASPLTVYSLKTDSLQSPTKGLIENADAWVTNPARKGANLANFSLVYAGGSVKLLYNGGEIMQGPLGTGQKFARDFGLIIERGRLANVKSDFTLQGSAFRLYGDPSTVGVVVLPIIPSFSEHIVESMPTGSTEKPYAIKVYLDRAPMTYCQTTTVHSITGISPAPQVTPITDNGRLLGWTLTGTAPKDAGAYNLTLSGVVKPELGSVEGDRFYTPKQYAWALKLRPFNVAASVIPEDDPVITSLTVNGLPGNTSLNLSTNKALVARIVVRENVGGVVKYEATATTDIGGKVKTSNFSSNASNEKGNAIILDCPIEWPNITGVTTATGSLDVSVRVYDKGGKQASAKVTYPLSFVFVKNIEFPGSHTIPIGQILGWTGQLRFDDYAANIERTLNGKSAILNIHNGTADRVSLLKKEMIIEAYTTAPVGYTTFKSATDTSIIYNLSNPAGDQSFTYTIKTKNSTFQIYYRWKEKSVVRPTPCHCNTVTRGGGGGGVSRSSGTYSSSSARVSARY